MNGLVERLRRRLSEAGSEEERLKSRRFFKEDIRNYGIKAPQVRKIAGEFLPEVRRAGREAAYRLSDELWRSGMMEESFVACEWTYAFHREFRREDFAWFARWVRDCVSNWASCDTLCNHTVGDCLMLYPELVSELEGWTASENRWVRRAAAVSLIIPARKGLFRERIFAIAEALLEDGDDMVRKGYGWMLKAAADFRQDDVFDFVCRRRGRMPRTALRYAIEKMPSEMRRRAMEKD